MNVRKIIALVVILIILAGAWVIALNGAAWGIYQILPLAQQVSLGLDLTGGISVVYEAVDMEDELLDEHIANVISVMRTRLDSAGFTEATIVQQGDGRIRIEIPINSTNMVDDPSEITQYLVKPTKVEFLDPDGNLIFDGSEIVSVSVSADPDAYLTSIVSFELNDKAKDAMQQVSTKMTDYYKETGEKQAINITVDGEMIANPAVTEVLNTNHTYIKGNFDFEYATFLKQQIESGAVPIEMEERETRSISATLGDDALERGLLAGVIAIAVIILFMIIYYRLPGVMSAISLLIYLLGMLICLATINGVQLTLPGIAGIILSIGMAVDADVIIFERFREELKKGKSIRTAVKTSYKRAFSSIFDSNITTIIAAVVLLVFGTGTIKGFGITLLIGIVLSFITSMFITRGLMYLMLGFNAKKLGWYYPQKRQDAAK